MTNIHLIGGEKGGVGKSVVARLLAQYFIDHSIAFLGFDSDRSHGALLRFYSGYASAVVIDRYESLDAIVEAAAEQPERRVLVDLAAQTQEPLTRWMDESQLLDVAPEIGLQIRYWHVMDSGKDCVDLLKLLLDRYEKRLNYVIVQNHLRGEQFDILKASGLPERAQALNTSCRQLIDQLRVVGRRPVNVVSQPSPGGDQIKLPNAEFIVMVRTPAIRPRLQSILIHLFKDRFLRQWTNGR